MIQTIPKFHFLLIVWFSSWKMKIRETDWDGINFLVVNNMFNLTKKPKERTTKGRKSKKKYFNTNEWNNKMSNKTKPDEISFQKANKHLRKVNAHIFKCFSFVCIKRCAQHKYLHIFMSMPIRTRKHLVFYKIEHCVYGNVAKSHCFRSNSQRN